MTSSSNKKVRLADEAYLMINLHTAKHSASSVLGLLIGIQGEDQVAFRLSHLLKPVKNMEWPLGRFNTTSAIFCHSATLCPLALSWKSAQNWYLDLHNVFQHSLIVVCALILRSLKERSANPGIRLWESTMRWSTITKDQCLRTSSELWQV